MKRKMKKKSDMLNMDFAFSTIQKKKKKNEE